MDQSWSVLRVAQEAMPYSWENVFTEALPELEDISRVLDARAHLGAISPLRADLFNAFHWTPLSSIKVVLLGQDPYPKFIKVGNSSVPQSVGASFSVRREDTIPSSLNNVYKELTDTVRGFVKPDHGDLREWAKQGVLLLNTCLTVQGKPKTHGDIWHGFINRVFRAIAAVNPHCIFLLWGREAQGIKPMLGERSVILEASHPSGINRRGGFLGCDHFNKVNEILLTQKKTTIDWRISSRAELQAREEALPKIVERVPSEPKFVPIDLSRSVKLHGTRSRSGSYESNSGSSPELLSARIPSPVIPCTPEMTTTASTPTVIGGSLMSNLIPSSRGSSLRSSWDDIPELNLDEPIVVPDQPEVPIIPQIKFGLFRSAFLDAERRH